jgi:hypothetical protein
VSLAARKKQKPVPSIEEKEEEKKQKNLEALRRRRQERQLYSEMAVKACLVGHVKDPYREKLREAIRNRVNSYSKSILKASSGRMHLAREMYRDVAHMETVEIPGEFVNKTFFRYLMHGTAGSAEGNERNHALHEKYPLQLQRYSIQG